MFGTEKNSGRFLNCPCEGKMYELNKQSSLSLYAVFDFQSSFVRGHRRTGSDVQFIERTRLDAVKAMNKELAKLIQTGPPGLQEVSGSGQIIRTIT